MKCREGGKRDFMGKVYMSSKVVRGGIWVCGLDWAGPEQGQVVDACECGNEPSGSIKFGEFLD